MAANGIGRPKVVSEMMNGTKYIDVLKKQMLPSARFFFSDDHWIFQDDNAPYSDLTRGAHKNSWSIHYLDAAKW